MRSLLALAATTLLVLGMAACGGSDPSAHKSRGSTLVGVHRTGFSFEIAHSVEGLEGDRDDDDLESHTAESTPVLDSDNDADNDVKDNAGLGYYDKDDDIVRSFGSRADSVEERRFVSIVRRYYQAAAASDGATACSLMDRDYARSIPEDYGKRPGPLYLRGKTCAVVMTLLFQHEHAHLARSWWMTAVRVKDDEALVLLGATAQPAISVTLQRQGARWGIRGLLGFPLP
jgi:hypothetical protein